MSRLAESSIGITEYISVAPGIKGSMKYRFSDFIVREVALDKTVVFLTDISGKVQGVKVQEPENDGVDGLEKLESLIGKEVAARVKTLSEQDEVDGATEIVLDVDSDKAHRTAVHACIKQHFEKLTTDTIKVGTDQQTAIRIFSRVASSKGRPNKRQRTEAIFQGAKRDEKAKFIKFVLYKENFDTMAAISMISKMAKTKGGTFSYAGTKDRRACTTQLVCAHRVDPIILTNLNKRLRNICIGNLSVSEQALKLGQLYGNRFEIILRDVQASPGSIEELCNSLKEKGFINYFGKQRFGTSSIPTYSIGREILHEDWEKAADLILCPRDGEKEESKTAREKFKEHKDPSKALEEFPRWMFAERTLLDVYKKRGMNSHLNAIQALPRNLRLMYIHSYQSYIWNKMVSERLRMYGKDKPAEGDLVLESKEVETENVFDMEGVDESTLSEAHAAAEDQESDQAKWIKSHPKKVKVLTAEDLDKYTIFDIVLPLPGVSIWYPTNEIGKKYEEALKLDGLDINNLATKNKEFTLSGDYRKILSQAEDFSWETIDYKNPKGDLQATDLEKIKGTSDADVQRAADEEAAADAKARKALKLSFTLRSSTYATMCVRELLKEHVEEAACGLSFEDKPGDKGE